MNPADTPLLLIAWRRPHTLRQVIDAIRPVAPTRIFVACDGPSPERPGEAEKVAATRRVIEHEIDWPCQIERLYSDVNQGCRLGVSRAITWFFEQVEEGIILEDDCVPHPDFFPYCATLLERYRHDTRVWCISGDNATTIKSSSPNSSYSFSGYPLIWGWATWTSRWAHFSLDYPNIDEISNESALSNSLFSFNSIAAEKRLVYWKKLHAGMGPDTWDAAWAYSCMINSGLSVIPRVNLVGNVGFGLDASHTTVKGGERDSAPTLGFASMIHPPFVIRDCLVDRGIESTVYGYSTRKESPVRRMSRKLILKLKSKLVEFSF